MNFFELDDSIDVSCNVGGFGIDGAVSTLVGQSMADREKLYFGQLGDLAFFYDMNALGIHHISNNLRLLLVNNGRGVEFRINPVIENQFAEKLDEFTAAAGHYGSAKAWAESVGFHYMSASSKDEFLANIVDFCSPVISRFEKPVLFEVFTTVKDEKDGLKLLREANKNMVRKIKDGAKSVAKSVLSQDAINKIIKIVSN
jgi:2-succinyl-5-enolpyruvyl-6-hydroxy-3-cyclohexene-1-carboxylate synthase